MNFMGYLTAAYIIYYVYKQRFNKKRSTLGSDKDLNKCQSLETEANQLID